MEKGTIGLKLQNKKFYTDGILIKRSFLNNIDKKRILNLLRMNLPKDFNYLKNLKDIENQLFHNNLIKIRKNKKFFGKIYDKINLSSELRSIFFQEKFLNIFKSVLNTNQIYLNGFIFRFDFPNDKRNALSWHQDSPYYLQSYPKFNAGVCWVPVTNNSYKNGTLQYLNGQTKKIIRSNYTNKNSYSTSQYTINIKKNDLDKIQNLDQNLGDISLLHMNLRHRSGINNSKKVRLSIACRFHCMKKLNIGKEIYFFNDVKLMRNSKFRIKKKSI